MRENRTPGSVRGASRKGRSYRDANEDMTKLTRAVLQIVRGVSLAVMAFFLFCMLAAPAIPVPDGTPSMAWAVRGIAFGLALSCVIVAGVVRWLCARKLNSQNKQMESPTTGCSPISNRANAV